MISGECYAAVEQGGKGARGQVRQGKEIKVMQGMQADSISNQAGRQASTRTHFWAGTNLGIATTSWLH
jgi:hypothetical protein